MILSPSWSEKSYWRLRAKLQCSYLDKEQHAWFLALQYLYSIWNGGVLFQGNSGWNKAQRHFAVRHVLPRGMLSGFDCLLVYVNKCVLFYVLYLMQKTPGFISWDGQKNGQQEADPAVPAEAQTCYWKSRGNRLGNIWSHSKEGHSSEHK